MRIKELGTGSLVLVVLGALAGLATGAALARETQSYPTPARDGEPSYRLLDLQIQYPFVEMTGSESEVDESRAGVRYSVAWSTAQYPGSAECFIALFDQDAQVGGSAFEWDSLQDVFELPEHQPIQVLREPTRGEAWCATGTYDPSNGYRIEDPIIEMSENTERLRLIGNVSWLSGVPPGSRLCTANFQLKNGASESLEFTLDSPEAQKVVLSLLPDSTTGATPLSVDCRAFDAGRAP